MKKIVPFTKDIIFDTNIYEINSISLEHTLSLKEDNIITGEFIVSGSYKMTEASINVDEFAYNLPFEISIDKKYNTKNVSVDINDFYYEIIDNKILSVNIEVSIDNLEEKEETKLFEEVREIENLAHNENKIAKEETREEIKDISTQKDNKIINEEHQNEVITSIFDDLDNNENFVTYKVHIITENDTVETILQKYEVPISTLEAYNNLSDLKIGDKIIIPTDD